MGRIYVTTFPLDNREPERIKLECQPVTRYSDFFLKEPEIQVQISNLQVLKGTVWMLALIVPDSKAHYVETCVNIE